MRILLIIYEIHAYPSETHKSRDFIFQLSGKQYQFIAYYITNMFGTFGAIAILG